MAARAQTGDAQIQSPAVIEAMVASSSKALGETYFPIMVETIANVLGTRWVLVCTLHPTDPGIVRTVAVWDHGLAKNFEYGLEHTPCANIVGQGACVYPDSICELYPRDQMLIDMGAVSYVGTPLRSAAGTVIGLLAALDDEPLTNPEEAKEIIEIFSGRAAAEIERLRTSSLNERLGRIVENSVSEVYIFDGDTYRFELVNRGARENLGYSMEELRRLTPWDLKPEFSREEFVRFVQPLKDGAVPTLTFETYHQRKDGSRYDVSVQLQFFSGIDNVFYASITDITERRRAEEARAHLAAIVASSDEAIISKDLDGNVRSWNQGAEKIFGFSAAEIIGRPIHIIIPPERQAEEEDIRERIRGGETFTNFETVRQRKDGETVDVSVTISPILDPGGKIIGASSIAHDISERKKAEARERLLTGEINHRAKNLLSLVQVIARQTAASDPVSFAKSFEERILALSASHDVLVHNAWQAVPLDQLILSQLGHFKGESGRITLAGPAVKVTAAAAQAIAMALHELATNAAKYGALSDAKGQVAIGWRIEDSDGKGESFALEWTERGGPKVSPPSRQGFGSKVIERMLQSRVGGKVGLDWQADGLVFRLDCPTSAILDAPAGPDLRPEPVPIAELDRPAGARNILVVEDETLIAIELSECLRDAGFSVVGPASSVQQASSLLDVLPCHAGILDINLGNETSAPVAQLLAERGCPFLTVSSCSADDRPAAYAGSPHLAKPVRPGRLVEEVNRMLEAAAEAEVQAVTGGGLAQPG